MAYGAGGGGQPLPPGQMLASEAERERCQAVLKQAFEDERLTQDEFESHTHRSLAAGLRDAVNRIASIDPAG